MLEMNGDDADVGLPFEREPIACLAALGRSHWLPSRMGAQSRPLIIFEPTEILSADERTDELATPASDDDCCETEAPVSQEEIGDETLTPAAEVSRGSPGGSHWLPSRMSAQSEPLIVPEPTEALSAVEPSEEPVASKSEDGSSASEARASRNEAGGALQMPAAAVSLGERKFGVGALIGSAFGGAAVALAVLLTFGISHGRWERAVDHDIYGDVIVPQSVTPTGQRIAFAEATVAFEPVQAAIPGVHSTRSANSSAIGGDDEISNDDEAERVAFSSLVLGASFASNEVFLDGTALTNASPVIASDVEATRDIPIESEPAVAGASFDDVELAAAFEASASPADGAVLSDGSGVIDAPQMPASGTLVVDQAASSPGVHAMDAGNAVITVPAGAKKVDAVLHLVTADGRLAYVSELSVVLGDKVRPATERQTPKAAPRKPVVPDSKATKAPKANPANRREARKAQPLPPPPRGLFNFNGYQGPKKASAASSDDRGPAG